MNVEPPEVPYSVLIRAISASDAHVLWTESAGFPLGPWHEVTVPLPDPLAGSFFALEVVANAAHGLIDELQGITIDDGAVIQPQCQ